MPRVLLIEDDPSIREGVGLGLRRRGHDVSAAETGEAGLELMASFHPELVLLDLMLPGINGVQVCRRIRETSQVPIIMLTARGDDFDIVVGLEAGADDYIVKPARTEVIEARIKAVLRRLTEPAGGRPDVEFHGELAVDRAGLTVARNGERLPWPPARSNSCCTCRPRPSRSSPASSSSNTSGSTATTPTPGWWTPACAACATRSRTPTAPPATYRPCAASATASARCKRRA